MTGDRPVGRIVAANMARLRREAGLTQEELGRRIGWQFRAVSAAERPDGTGRLFAIDDVARIAGALGTTITDLVTPEPPCSCCQDKPPAGMKCLSCGREEPAW